MLREVANAGQNRICQCTFKPFLKYFLMLDFGEEEAGTILIFYHRKS
jgi:hypothetical protein